MTSDLSSQGGLTLFHEFDRRIGFISRPTSCLKDTQTPHLIQHSHEEMLSQRIFLIAADYKDGDDCDLLRNDSLLKMCSGRISDTIRSALFQFAQDKRVKNTCRGKKTKLLPSQLENLDSKLNS